MPVSMTQPYTSCIAWHHATLRYWLDKREKRKEILVEVEDPNSDRGELLRLRDPLICHIPLSDPVRLSPS